MYKSVFSLQANKNTNRLKGRLIPPHCLQSIAVVTSPGLSSCGSAAASATPRSTCAPFFLRLAAAGCARKLLCQRFEYRQISSKCSKTCYKVVHACRVARDSIRERNAAACSKPAKPSAPRNVYESHKALSLYTFYVQRGNGMFLNHAGGDAGQGKQGLAWLMRTFPGGRSSHHVSDHSSLTTLPPVPNN